MSTYSLPWWYIAITEVAWYASRLWLHLLRMVDRASH